MKKLLCLSLMLFSSISFAIEFGDEDIGEVCGVLYEEFAEPIYTQVLRPASFNKQKLLAKTDKEASIKLLQVMKTKPEILKEMAYGMGGDIEEAKQLVEVSSTIHNHTHTVFYNSQGKLRSLKEVEGLWTYQCNNGRMEKLFEYLASLED